MEWPFEDPLLPKLRLSRLALNLTALALCLLCAAKLLVFAPFFRHGGVVNRLLSHPLWTWGVEPVITFGSLLGALLLLGCWKDSSWRAKAGLLVFLDSIDALMWLLMHSREMGLSQEGFGHRWLVNLVTLGSGWVELYLAAVLAQRVLARIDRDEPSELGGSIPAMATIGGMLWAILLFTQTDWSWPLRPMPAPPGHMFNLQLHLLLLVSTLFQAILTYQVTLVCLTVSRRVQAFIRHRVAEVEQFDLLRSRSETEGDDVRWL